MRYVFALGIILYCIHLPQGTYGGEKKTEDFQESNIENKEELARIQGRWQLIEYKQVNPKGVSGLEFTGRFSGTMNIKGDNSHLIIKVLGQELELTSTIVLRPTLKPKQWDTITPNPFRHKEPNVSKYIYNLTEEKLTISFYTDPKNKARPENFKGPVKAVQTVMVWQKQNAK